MNFGQGHGLAVWRPSLELPFLTQHFNQVQSHSLIYTTLIYPAVGLSPALYSVGYRAVQRVGLTQANRAGTQLLQTRPQPISAKT